MKANGGRLSALGDMAGAYDEARGWYDKGDFAYKTYLYCQASDADNCPLMVALCVGYKQFVSPIVSKYFVISDFADLALNYYCLGEPTLKCCRKQSGGGCWLVHLHIIFFVFFCFLFLFLHRLHNKPT